MRVRGLDVLRAVAVLLVLGRHQYLTYAWFQAGWAGVDLFFVLSGFLISGLLFVEYRRSGRIRVGRFLLRRGFKIYPAYYVVWNHTWSLAVEEHADTAGFYAVHRQRPFF